MTGFGRAVNHSRVSGIPDRRGSVPGASLLQAIRNRLALRIIVWDLWCAARPPRSPRVEVAIMTRSEFDDIRAHLAAEADHASDLLRIARNLLDDLEQAHMREAVLRSRYLGLLTAARASVAAESAGYVKPLMFVEHELDRHGQLPTGDETVHRILADAQTAAALAARIEVDEVPPRRGSPRSRAGRCGGLSRRLAH